jgi:hypothetical protein
VLQPSARAICDSEAFKRNADRFWGSSSRNPCLRDPAADLSPLAGRPKLKVAQSLLSLQLGRSLPSQLDHSPAKCSLSQRGGSPSQESSSSTSATLTDFVPPDAMPPRCSSRHQRGTQAMPCFVSARNPLPSIPYLPSGTGTSSSWVLPCLSASLRGNQQPTQMDNSRSPQPAPPTTFTEERAIPLQPLREKVLCAIVSPSVMEGGANVSDGEPARATPTQKSCSIRARPSVCSAKRGTPPTAPGAFVASGDIVRAAQTLEAWDAPARPPSLGVLSEPPTPSSCHPHSVLQGSLLKYC